MYEDILRKLSQSSFRNRFHLSDQDKQYVRQKGIETIRKHAQDFIQKRIAPEVILNDGKQTPMRGHPVFIAQHATATCCRGCIEKWHYFSKGYLLTEKEQEYLIGLIMLWIDRQMLEEKKQS